MVSRPAGIEPEGLFDGLHWSSILRGAVLDNVLTLIALLPIMFYVAGAEALSDDEVAASRAIDQAIVAPEFLFWSFIIGISITAYAAFWASRRAGTLHLRHGGWTAVLSAVIASMFLLVPDAAADPQPPLWYNGLSLGLMIPTGIFGGWVASRRQPAAS